MIHIHAEWALTPQGWRRNVRLAIESGRIANVQPDTTALPGDERAGVLLPAISNLHSHAFQRGMAGLAELRGPTADTFWTWRDVMYRFALSMTPQQVEAVAAQLYVEMLEAGFCRVGEFHYLHHDHDGRPYASLGEMAERIAAAAGETGIGLTLLPVFYAHATFGGEPATPYQRRFVNDLDRYARLLEASRTAVAGLPNALVGVAPHSLRAVTPDELADVLELAGPSPIHIHAAEQVKEVEDCLSWSGIRPVEWLLDHAPVDDRWCLIHATHMTPKETEALAHTGAVAGLCPITEANLGDGVFDAPRFMAAGGRFGIGSDSNILVGVADELRQLEYAQRLALRCRNVIALPGGSTGRTLFAAAVSGGSAALGCEEPAISSGAPANLVALDAGHLALAGRTGDGFLDSWIFAAGNAVVDSVWVDGRKLVAGGRHHKREAIAQRFRAVMQELAAS